MIRFFKKVKARLRYEKSRTKNYIRAYWLFLMSLYHKECYFGPFVGEFGHLLSHIVPFISYLHSKGVKVHYCGTEIHKAFFSDDKERPIVASYFGLRDFYGEVSPMCNDQLYPDDVREEICKYINKATNSRVPFWDIRTRAFYWDVFCKWEYLNGFVKVYKKEKTKTQNSQKTIVVFARKKGNPSPVRGEDWDFQKLIDAIKDMVYRVVVLGHPAFSHEIKSSKNVDVFLTTDNSIILENCSSADLIINQLSGTHYLGVYTNTRVLLLLKGKIDYSNINKDRRYRKKLNEKYPLEFAHSIEDVKAIIKKL